MARVLAVGRVIPFTGGSVMVVPDGAGFDIVVVHGESAAILSTHDTAEEALESVRSMIGSLERMPPPPDTRKNPDPSSYRKKARPVRRGTDASTIISAVMGFARKHGLAHDMHGYTAPQWRARKEPFGNDAICAFTFEGGFYSFMNGYLDLQSSEELAAEFNALLEDLGVWYELGFAWSMHIYPLDSA